MNLLKNKFFYVSVIIATAVSCSNINKDLNTFDVSKKEKGKIKKKSVLSSKTSQKANLCLRKDKYKIKKLLKTDVTAIKTHRRTSHLDKSFSDYIGVIRYIDINKDGDNDMIVTPTVDGSFGTGTDKILYLNCGNDDFVNVWLDANTDIELSWNKELSSWVIITANYIFGPSMAYPNGGEFFEKYKINFQTGYYEGFENNYPKDN